jgi:hypothetical protein
VIALTLTLSRAVAVLHGVLLTDLQRPELPCQATHALRSLLESRGFDVDRPISVIELPDHQGFHLIQ